MIVVAPVRLFSFFCSVVGDDQKLRALELQRLPPRMEVIRDSVSFPTKSDSSVALVIASSPEKKWFFYLGPKSLTDDQYELFQRVLLSRNVVDCVMDSYHRKAYIFTVYLR